MRFFVPGVHDDEAVAAWERMREACGALKETGPTYSLTYEHGGAEIVATVGESTVERRWQPSSSGERDESQAPTETRTGNVVVAIMFAGESFCVFEEGDSASDNPSLASVESVVETAFFDDD